MARKAKPAPKRPRRKPGTGGVRHRKAREKPYEAYFPIDGQQPRYEAFYTEAEAIAWLDQLTEETRKGTRNLAGGSMLVESYLPMWLELRQGHVSPKTLAGYTYYCEYACGEGEIGKLKLDTVDPLIAQRMINTLAADGFKNTAQLKAVLYQAFEYAFDPLEYIKKNPFAKVAIPHIDHKETAALTKAERTRMLLEAMSDDLRPLARQSEPPPPLAPIWHLYSRLAFRKGEGLALRWNTVDLESAIITITTTRGRLGATHIEGRPKNKKPRPVPIPADLVELLKAHKAAQMRAALANGWRWAESGYVFVDPATGEPLKADIIRHRWGRIKKAAKVDCTIHGLRHTSLSILALEGAPAAIRKRLSGHSTAKMDELYTSHAEIDDVRRALEG